MGPVFSILLRLLVVELLEMQRVPGTWDLQELGNFERPLGGTLGFAYWPLSCMGSWPK